MGPEVNSNRFEICLHGNLFRWKIHCSLKFQFGQIDRSEICTEVRVSLCLNSCDR